jgi:hypothetical protein
MEHMASSYTLLQTANPTGWKWIVQLDERRRDSSDPSLAIRRATMAIDNAIKLKRR